MKVVDNFFIFPTVYSIYPFEFWNSIYDWYSDLLMLDVTQKISDSVNSCNCHVDITKKCLYTLECRWKQGEEAEAEAEAVAMAMAMVAMAQSLWRNLCKLRMRWCTFSYSTYSSNLDQHHHLFMWGISVGSLWRKTSGIYTLSWSHRGRWLVTCRGEATEHSPVQWYGKSVVCFWTTSRCSSDMVGVVSSCSSQQCSFGHLVGVL